MSRVNAWFVVLAWALAASVVQLRERRRSVQVARAGHEVRGPLCVARLALDGLERSARVEAIDQELRRAALALDDLAGAGHRRGGGSRVVSIGRLFEQADHTWRPLAAAHGAELVIEPPHPRALVVADPLRLTQACANLVANAVEHGGGRVRVRASTAAGRVRIEVSDDGPGLPAPIPTLTAAARSRRTRRGHGLAIAASIAERYGGCLTSAPTSAGACVVLDLPAAPPRAARRASTSTTMSLPAPAMATGSP